ncbi:MAG TPA: site-2 protease family protein [Candidatus Limnocylindrales bacterium]|jgi:Zn-dependent protease
MNGLPVARLFGFEIRIHLSWVLIVALVTIIVVGQVEASAPSVPMPVRWIIGAIISGAFLLSVLAHELGHGLAARRRGLDVGPITLYFFGGSASFQLESDRPRDEAIVAGAGPALSLALGIAFGVVALALNATGQPEIQAFAAIVLVAAALNFLLGLVNLVPAYPLDGGRVVRALVWARTGDERRGASVASRLGRIVGWMLIGGGIALMVIDSSPIDGLMLALSGWFLGSASRGIERRLVVQDLLKGVRVEDVMEREYPSVAPNLTVDTFAERLLETGPGSAMPVLHDDRIVGLIGASELRRLRRGLWPTTRAEDVMVALPRLPLLAARDTLWSALDRLGRSGLDGLPVVDGGGLLGVVTRQTIAEAIQSRAKLRGVTIR